MTVKVPLKNSQLLSKPFLIISGTSLAVIAISIFSLMSGWTIIFQNLFYVPIIIACVYYTKKGFIFSVILSFTYFIIITLFTQDFTIAVQAFIRLVIFILIAAVTTFLSLKHKYAEFTLKERKQTEIRLRKLNRIYTLLSNVNQKIMRLHEPLALFNEACRIAVEHGGFCMAWIGLVDYKTKQIKPVAHAGTTNGYLGKLNITIDNNEHGLDPTGMALCAGRYVLVNDIANDSSMTPWRDDALRLGYRSFAAFPLTIAKEVRGTLNLYATEPDFFDEDELKLLEEMAGDIAFSLEFAEKEEKRVQLENINLARLHLLQYADSHSLEEHLEETLNEIENLTGSIIGFYHFMGDDQRTLSLQNWSTRTKNEYCRAEGKGLHYAIASAGVWVDCIYERRPVIHNDYELLTHKRGLPPGHAAVVRELTLPIIRGGKIKAIIGIGNKPTEYTDKDVEIASQLAEFSWEISDRKMAEKALQQANERLTLAQISARAGVWDWDITYNKIIWSPELFHLFDIDTEIEPTFELWADILHPEDRRKAEIRINEAIRNHKPLFNEYRIVKKNGEIIWIDALGDTTYDCQGKAVRMSGICIDVTTRKSAEEAVMASKEYAEKLIRTANAIIITLNNKGDITVFNQTAEKITGYKRAELKGRNWFEVLVPKDRYPEVWEEFIKLKGGRMPKEFENPILTKSGEERFIVWQNNVLREKGQIIGIISFGIDITDRRLAEKKVRASEEFLESIIAQSPYGYCIADADGNIIRVNKACCELMNISESDVVGKYNVLKDNNIKEQGMLPLIQSVFMKGETVRFEITYDTAKFKQKELQRPIYVTLDTTVFPIKDSEGKVINIVIQHVNITRRKQTENELQKYHYHLEELVKERTIKLEEANIELQNEINERKRIEEELARERNVLKTLIDNVPDEIYAKDNESKFIMANSHVVKSLWKSRLEEVINRTDFDILPHDEALKYYNDEQSLLNLNKQIINYETSRQDENGDIRWYSVIKVPLLDSENNISGIVGINRDITLFKMAEENFKKAKEAAESANRAKSTFLSSMSHEIRTPLNSILGFSQLMLRDENLTTDQIEYMGTINRSGEHLLTLINDILEISKIEAGRTAFYPAVFNLYSLINDIETMFRIKANEKKLSLLVEYPQDLPKYILTDEGKLRQILINIVGNAVKFTEEGGIAVRILTDDMKNDKAVLIIEVEDTGPGIAEKDIEKLFQMFGQIESGVKEGGTGLGLVISREYARIMEGDITIKSEINKGSCFTIKVKIEKKKEISLIKKAGKERVIGLASGQKYRVLIADDRRDNRILLNKMLSSVGFEVNEAVNGKEVVDKYKSWSPDIIIMDMRMPEMDGYEATRLIKAMDKRIPIIAVTASAFHEDKLKALEAGADQYLRKPFKEQELFDIIETLLNVPFVYEKQK